MAHDLEAPTRASSTLRAQKLAAIAARFGIDLLGPPGTLP